MVRKLSIRNKGMDRNGSGHHSNGSCVTSSFVWLVIKPVLPEFRHCLTLDCSAHSSSPTLSFLCHSREAGWNLKELTALVYSAYSKYSVYICWLFLSFQTWRSNFRNCGVPPTPHPHQASLKTRFSFLLIIGKWILKAPKLYIYTVAYYSAIKKNTFEPVLMRWMKLEPIIQSEVSQKDKDQYSILTHIYGI